MRRANTHDYTLGVLLVGLTVLLPAALPAPHPTSTDTEPMYRRVCYYTNWSQYRKNGARFLPANIDPFLCTHIVFAFAKVDERGQLAPYEWNDIQYPYVYRQFTSLKKENPALKALLAVGGWTHGSGLFTEMVHHKKGRQAFLEHALQYLRTHNFDGLDLDWEYPANRGSPPEDKDNFSLLIKELREGFEEEAVRTGKPRLLLTAAVAGGEKIVMTAYDVPKLDRYLDFINLMSYDLHGSWSSYLGHNAPLYAGNYHTSEGSITHSVDQCVQLWLRLGASREKLVVGVPFYGRSFTLCSEADTKPGMRNCGSGRAAPYTQEKGFASFYEVEEYLVEGWERVWVEEEKVPYAFHAATKQWVGYDDIDSIKIKAQYVKDQGLGGAMVWALDLDDFAGLAHMDSPYPLGNALRAVLTDNQQFPDFKPPPIPEKDRKRQVLRVKSTTDEKNSTPQPTQLINPEKLKLVKASEAMTNPKVTPKADNSTGTQSNFLYGDNKQDKLHLDSPFSGLPQTLSGRSTTLSRTTAVTTTPSTQTTTSTTASTTTIQQQNTDPATTTAASNSAGKGVPIGETFKQQRKIFTTPAASADLTSTSPKPSKLPLVVNPYLKFRPLFLTTLQSMTETSTSSTTTSTSRPTTSTPHTTTAKGPVEKTQKLFTTSPRTTVSSTTSTTSHNSTTATPTTAWRQRLSEATTVPVLASTKTTATTSPATQPTSTTARRTTNTTVFTTSLPSTSASVLPDISAAKTTYTAPQTSTTVTSTTPNSETSASTSDTQWLLHAMTASPQPITTSTRLPVTAAPNKQSLLYASPEQHPKVHVNKTEKVSITSLVDKPAKPTEAPATPTRSLAGHQPRQSDDKQPERIVDTKSPREKMAGKHQEDTLLVKSYSVKSGEKIESKNIKGIPSWIAPVNKEQKERLKTTTPPPTPATENPTFVRGRVISSTPQTSTQKDPPSTIQTKIETEMPYLAANSIYSSMKEARDSGTRQDSSLYKEGARDQDTDVKPDRVWSSSKSVTSSSPSTTSPTSAAPQDKAMRRTKWWEASTKPTDTTSTTVNVTSAPTAAPVPTPATSASSVRSTSSSSLVTHTNSDSTTSTITPVRDRETTGTTSTPKSTSNARDHVDTTRTTGKSLLSFSTRRPQTADPRATERSVGQTHRRASPTATLKTYPSTLRPGQTQQSDGSRMVWAPVSPSVTQGLQHDVGVEDSWADTSRSPTSLLPAPRHQAEDPSIRARTKAPRPLHPTLRLTMQDGDISRDKTKFHSLKVTSVQDLDRPQRLKWWHKSPQFTDRARHTDVMRPQFGQTRTPLLQAYTSTSKDCDKGPKVEQFMATGQQPENMRAGEVSYQVKQAELSPRFRTSDRQHESSEAEEMETVLDTSLQETDVMHTDYQPTYSYNPPDYHFECPTVFGIYSDPRDCRRFYQCVWLVAFHHACGLGTVWNDDMKICDWPTPSSCRT